MVSEIKFVIVRVCVMRMGKGNWATGLPITFDNVRRDTVQFVRYCITPPSRVSNIAKIFV